MYLADCGTYTNGRRDLPGDIPRGCPVEYNNGNPQWAYHNDYLLSQHYTWVPGVAGDREHLLRSQSDPKYNIYKGIGPLKDLPGLPEGV